jgi:D-glycero-D-manno-heptose 1,7-bisphosphate phosphatase
MIADSDSNHNLRSYQETTDRRPAVFLDRDGTLIEDVDYLSDPALIRFLPGAIEALKRLRGNGYACVIVTNQSGIARGMITHEQLGWIHDEMLGRLREQDTTLDGIYYCDKPPGGAAEWVIEHEDRKPGPGMLVRAAAELGLELGSSWMVGDKLSDVLAGSNAGCRGSIRLRTGKGRSADSDAMRYPDFPVVDGILEAASMILEFDVSPDKAPARSPREGL